MAKWILGMIGCLLIVFVAVGLFLPKTFHLSRTKTIAANRIRIAMPIMQLEQWESWWPWERTKAGHRLNVATNLPGGATLSWTGRPAPGSLQLTDNTIFKIGYEVQFDRNQTPDTGAFEFRDGPGGTLVTWSMDGHFEQPVLGGYLALMADAMHGGMLDWGLGNIKDLVENDTSEMNLYYLDDQGNEVEERLD